MPEALDRVWAAVDARRDEAVELLQELVRTRSVNPNYPGISREEHIGGETRVNEILQSLYADAGLETHWVAEDPERRNLVGIRRGTGGGRSLLLNGHIDTVPPAEADRWLCGSPWTPEIRDGRMYGLGSTDMKASAVSMWLAARALDGRRESACAATSSFIRSWARRRPNTTSGPSHAFGRDSVPTRQS